MDSKGRVVAVVDDVDVVDPGDTYQQDTAMVHQGLADEIGRAHV